MKSNPYSFFEKWYRSARAENRPQPDAMVLATVGPGGAPSARVVLHKGVFDGNFFFVTCYESKKGREIKSNPKAALVFCWLQKSGAHRQIRIEGRVTLASPRVSDAYWRSRPRGSQLSAMASHQSHPIASRAQLVKAIQKLKKKYQGKDLPRPKNWGGYFIEPQSFEFWQGRKDRLHDRYLYTRSANQKTWKVVCLAP